MISRVCICISDGVWNMCEYIQKHIFRVTLQGVRRPIDFKSTSLDVSFSGPGECNTSIGHIVRRQTISGQLLSQIGDRHLVFEYLNIDSDNVSDYRYLVPRKTNLMNSSRDHLFSSFLVDVC